MMHAQLKAEHYKFVEQILEHFLKCNNYQSGWTIKMDSNKWLFHYDSQHGKHVFIWFYEFNLCLTCFDY